jgi:DNA-binding transcriptional MerR regulator/methylmalonyl-CoA mutase cobalamin-binding subunit
LASKILHNIKAVFAVVFEFCLNCVSIHVQPMKERIHTVKAVARRTGLSPHVIRVWEKRYQAVTPGRTEGNQRLYSDDEVERLELLRKVTEAGHSIGRVAQLPDSKLRELAELAGHAAGSVGPQQREETQDKPEELLPAALRAIAAMEPAKLEFVLGRAATALGQIRFLNDMVAPLAREIGERWAKGELSAAHEHMASAVIRALLFSSARPLSLHAAAPGLVVATPAGQLHELGAAMAATLAAHQGWRVTYLGSSLPATEIAGAARRTGARAVALSIVYPQDDPQLPEELWHLRTHLPERTRILVGGRAAPAYAAVLNEIGAMHCPDLPSLATALEQARDNS